MRRILLLALLFFGSYAQGLEWRPIASRFEYFASGQGVARYVIDVIEPVQWFEGVPLSGGDNQFFLDYRIDWTGGSIRQAYENRAMRALSVLREVRDANARFLFSTGDFPDREKLEAELDTIYAGNRGVVLIRNPNEKLLQVITVAYDRDLEGRPVRLPYRDRLEDAGIAHFPFSSEEESGSLRSFESSSLIRSPFGYSVASRSLDGPFEGETEIKTFLRDPDLKEDLTPMLLEVLIEAGLARLDLGAHVTAEDVIQSRLRSLPYSLRDADPKSLSYKEWLIEDLRKRVRSRYRPPNAIVVDTIGSATRALYSRVFQFGRPQFEFQDPDVPSVRGAVFRLTLADFERKVLTAIQKRESFELLRGATVTFSDCGALLEKKN